MFQSSCTSGSVSPLQVSCQWNATYDPQSGIKRYNISLSTDKLDTSRVFFQELSGYQYSFTSPILNLDTSLQYYVTLYIENGAGLVNILTSTLSSCDSTPPISTGSVSIVPNYANSSYSEGMIIDKQIDTSQSAVCVWYANSLTVSFPPFTDDESGIKEYQLGIGTSVASDDVVSYSIITPTLSSQLYQVNNLVLNASYAGPLYFTIRAINNAFLYTDSTSNAVYVKSTTNRGQSWVYDGTIGTDIDFQNTTTYISGIFHYSVNCPLKSLEWAVEGTDGIIVKNFTDIPLTDNYHEMDFTFSTDQITLYNGETYRLIIRGNENVYWFLINTYWYYLA